jgi:hypothetical protein
MLLDKILVDEMKKLKKRERRNKKRKIWNN